MKKNLILRYFGLLLLIIGISLNIKMYIDKAWPTFLFYVIIIIGILQIIISILCKQMKKKWQILWLVLPITIGYIYLYQIAK